MAKIPHLHRTIREQIVSHLRTEVLTGELASGTQLREQPLSERFGVSRGPVRDALLQLTNEGLLVAKQNRGVHVREMPNERTRPLVVDLRRQVEIFALDTIFDDIEPADLDAWRLNLGHFRAACELQEMSAVVEHDIAFHRSIVERAGDQGLTAIWLPIITQMLLPYSRHQSLLESFREHQAILTAIESGDRSLAIDRLRENIQ